MQTYSLFAFLAIFTLAIQCEAVTTLRGANYHGDHGVEVSVQEKELARRMLFEDPSDEACGSHGTYYDVTDNLSGETETGCTCEPMYYSLNGWCDYKQKDGYQATLLQFFFGGFQVGSFYTDPYEFTAILSVAAFATTILFKSIGKAMDNALLQGMAFLCAIGYCIAVVWGSVNLFHTDYRDENDAPIYWSVHGLTGAVQIMSIMGLIPSLTVALGMGCSFSSE